MTESSRLPLTTPDLIISHGGRDYLVTVDDGPITIGRQFPAQVIVDDPRISRNHLRLEPTESGWWAHDHSANGVYISGQRAREFAVSDGLVVHLGHPDGLAVDFAHNTAREPAAERSGSDADDVATSLDGTTAPDDGDEDDFTAAVDGTDVGVARAGAAVAARRRELDISQRALAADKIVNAGALIAFEKGRSWPRRSTLSKLEEVLQWETGTIDRIRQGRVVLEPGASVGGEPALGAANAGAADAAVTEAVTTNIVGAPLMAQAVALALSAINSRVEHLDSTPGGVQHEVIAELLGELRNLERVTGEAASMATQAPTVMMALSEVRRTYRALMLRAARSPDATRGQRLFALRDRAQLTVSEAANAAGIAPGDVEDAEADRPLSARLEAAVGGLSRWLSGER